MRHWLKQMRKSKNLTQLEVAQLSGISRSYYADIERGTANAGGATAKSISDVLGFEMSLFFTKTGRETRQKQSKSA